MPISHLLNVCKHLEQHISELTYKQAVQHRTAGTRICQGHTCPRYAQTPPCTELRFSIRRSYAEVQICAGSTQGNYALICESAERYRSVCHLPRAGLCVPEPGRSICCWVCANTVYTGLQDTAASQSLANLIAQIFTEMHSFSIVHYQTI